MHSLTMPTLSDNNFSDLVKLTMHKDHNPHDETIAFNNFGEELFDWNFSACVDESPHGQCRAVQHELVYDEDAECLPDMWINWLNITSETQTLDNVFGASSSACISTSPHFSSQISADFLTNSDTSYPTEIKNSSTQPSPLSSSPLPYVSNELHLQSFSGNDHVSEQHAQHLHTHMGSLLAPDPPPPETNFMAPLTPPLVDVKATARQPPSYLTPKSSSYKKKQAATVTRNHEARKNEEAETYLAESIQDGYVWHKYGQKWIKNRMHSRGYFKCAHPNCPVKKRTESSSDMQGSLLISYIGKHNHLFVPHNPQANKKTKKQAIAY